MALNAVLSFFTSEGGSTPAAKGECKLPNYEKWIEVQGWDWEVEAESSWTKGGGASVGKPNPGKMNWEHYFDMSSCTLLNFMCTGKAFPEARLLMLKSTGKTVPEPFFTMTMTGAFITKVSNSATDEGNVLQKVEMVFKSVQFFYLAQNNKDNLLTAGKGEWRWDIPSGVVTGAT